jgi:pSer/pThr/pTyr-binding forkhead associated (FHA) protein
MAGERRTDEFGGQAVGGEGLDAELDRAVPSGDALAYLVLIAGEQPGRVFALHRNTIVIGRTEEVDVSITDGSVSTRHARIINGSHGFEVEDLRSTNGTMVGGRRVTRAPLHNGDRLTVGRVELVFLLDRPTNVTVQIPGRTPNLPPTGALVATGATLLRPLAPTYRGTPRTGHAPFVPGPYAPGPYPPPAEQSEDSGPSLVELVIRAVKIFRFLRPNLPRIAASVAVFVILGALSLVVVPPRQVAVSLIKLLPEVKTNPVTNETRPDENSLFFQGPERAFAAGDLVHASLLKLENWDATDNEVAAVAARLKLEGQGDHLYRAEFADNVLKDRGKPPPLKFLPFHIRAFVQTEINHALREFNAKVAFLRDQVKAVDADLARINEQRTKFREANADKLPEDSAQTHTSRFQLDSRHADLTAQVRRLQADLAAARLQVAADRPSAKTRYESSQAYRDSLADVNRKLSEAYASGLADGHPEVQQLKAERDRLDELMKSELQSHTELDRKTDPHLQAEQGRIEGLEAQLNAARSDLADTDKNLAQVRKLVDALPRVEQVLLEMTNQMEAQTRLRSQLFEKLKQAELQLNLEEVSAQSRYDIGPIRLEKPGKAKTLMIRCGVGLFAGLLTAGIWLLSVEGRRLVSEAMTKLDGSGARVRRS